MDARASAPSVPNFFEQLLRDLEGETPLLPTRKQDRDQLASLDLSARATRAFAGTVVSGHVLDEIAALMASLYRGTRRCPENFPGLKRACCFE